MLTIPITIYRTSSQYIKSYHGKHCWEGHVGADADAEVFGHQSSGADLVGVLGLGVAQNLNFVLLVKTVDPRAEKNVNLRKYDGYFKM